MPRPYRGWAADERPHPRNEWTWTTYMSSPLRQDRPADALIETLGNAISIEWRPMPVAVRLHYSRRGDSVLYLNPGASEAGLERGLVEVLAVLVAGPEAAVSARRARHLHALP